MLVAGSVTPALAHTPIAPAAYATAATPVAAPKRDKNYEGYTVTVGVFDEDGKQVGTPQKLPFNQLQTQVTGLESNKKYTVKVLSIMDDKGKDVTAQFTHDVSFTEEVIPGKTRDVWVKSPNGIQAGQQKLPLSMNLKAKPTS